MCTKPLNTTGSLRAALKGGMSNDVSQGASCSPALSARFHHWWTPTALSTLLLLCYGENFWGARVETFEPALVVRQWQVSPDGRSLLIWLRLSPSLSPRPYRLSIRTPHGEVSLPFLLKPRHALPFGRQGLADNEVIYLLMPDRFCDGDPANNDPKGLSTFDRTNPRAYHGGDLKGLRDRLPYLKDLGVTAIWHTPIYDNDDASPDEYHGYHPVDHFAVDEHLGTMDEYRAFVREAHQLGLKVVQDHVLNHCGPKHPWVQHPPTPTWLHPKAPADYRLALLLQPDAPAEAKRRITDGWLFGILPDLNLHDPAVAQFLLQHSLWWLAETGADAVRVDTMPYMPRPFLQRWREALRQEFPKVTVIGEVLPVPPDPKVQAFFQGGRVGYDGVDTGFESVFDFALAVAIREVFGRDTPMGRLKEVLEADSLYPTPHRLVGLLGNHDFPRFVTFAKPDRRFDRLKLATAFLLTTRGSVQWYYGDEIGMEGGDDPDNRRDFPGGFAGDLRDAFSPKGRLPEEERLWQSVRRLFHLRRQWALWMKAPTYWWRLEADQIVYERRHKNLRMFVALNKSQRLLAYRLPVPTVRLLWGRGRLAFQNGQWWLFVPSWEGAIVLGKDRQ
ncbi:MAG: alpha-amylase [Candidatus Fervidibacterota bacterium]